MHELCYQALNALIDFNLKLPDSDAWDGEFRDGLSDLISGIAPESGRPASDVLDQAVNEIFPFTLKNAHPKCFGFVPSSPTWPSVVADLLASGFNPNACTWLVASGPTHVELEVIDWIKSWIGYPESAGGLMTSGSSVASIEAFAAAREASGNPDKATVYLSDQTHGSLIRAARVIGISPDRIRIIPSDDDFAVDLDELNTAVCDDLANGFHPILLSANAGTTATGTVDPLERIAQLCEKHGIWFHVDAAYGGFACVTQQGKQILRGIDRADSITLDAHKWFFQSYESGVLLVRDNASLEQCFGMRPDILQDTVWGANHPNIANRGVQLTRSFRALKLWMSIHVFGLQAFRGAIESGMTIARQAERYIDSSATLEKMNNVVLSVLCFRFNPKSATLSEAEIEEKNRAILVRVFWDDNAFISSTLLRGTFCLRMCIVNHTTTWNDVEETLKAIENFGSQSLK